MPSSNAVPSDATALIGVLMFGDQLRSVTIVPYIVHVEYMDYVYGASRVLTVFISVAGPYGGGRPVDPLISLELVSSRPAHFIIVLCYCHSVSSSVSYM
jgi:hypothetical protein